MADNTDLWTATVAAYDSQGLIELTNLNDRSQTSVNGTVGQTAAQAVIDLWPAYAQVAYDGSNALHVEVGIMGVISMLWRRGGSSSTIEQVKWDEVFGRAPEGEFEWKQDEGGDWTPEQGSETWAQTCDLFDMGRDKDGKRWLERHEGDCGGNWEMSWRLEDDEDGKGPDDAWQYLLDLHCHHHLRAVSEYYVYVTETGDDCLDDYYHPKALNPQVVLDSLERYLRQPTEREST